MAVCVCRTSPENTGTPSKQSIASIAKILIAVPLYADDGTRNQIDLENDTLNQAYFDALINQADGSKRWYPLPLVDNVEDLKQDPQTQSLNSGSTLITADGIRTFTALMVGNGPVLLGKLQSLECFKFGLFVVDRCGNLSGDISSDGLFLRPTPVNRDSWNPRLVKSTDSTRPAVQLDFEYTDLAKDEDLRIITAAETGAALLDAIGLLDVNAATSGISATTVTVALTLDYGSAIDPIKVLGWVLADFDLNVVGGAPVSISSVTETDPGVSGIYDIVFASTPASTLRLTDTKNGYELSVDFVTP